MSWVQQNESALADMSAAVEAFEDAARAFAAKGGVLALVSDPGSNQRRPYRPDDLWEARGADDPEDEAVVFIRGGGIAP